MPADVRLTEQRTLILEELKKLKSHPTADQVYDLVRKRMPKIGLATVYRNLEFLSSVGLVQKLELAGNQRRYDGDIKPHLHVRCLGCGSVGDATLNSEVPDLRPDARSSYSILEQRIEFLGTCPECSQELEQKPQGNFV